MLSKFEAEFEEGSSGAETERGCSVQRSASFKMHLAAYAKHIEAYGSCVRVCRRFITVSVIVPQDLRGYIVSRHSIDF